MSTAFRSRVTDSKARAFGPNAAKVPGAGAKPRTDYAVRAMRQGCSNIPQRDVQAKILAPHLPEFRPSLLK